MNYLITGGCGFIGTNIIERIFNDDRNAYVRVVDNLQSGRKDMLATVCSYTESENIFVESGGVHLFINDIKNPAMAMRLCKDIDTVIHLAANTGVPISVQYPMEDCQTNVLGILNYLEAARHSGVKNFIFSSTSSAAGGYEPPFHEDLFPRPLAPYGASKGAGEAYCYVYNAIYGLDTVALRFSNVYGPNSTNKKEQLIPNFILGALAGDTLEIFGDGTQTRDYCFVGDLMDAIMLAINKSDVVGGNVIQIATNIGTSVQQITDLIVDKLDVWAGVTNIKIKYVGERPGDLQRNYSDVTKAKELLGWKYNTGIEEGLQKTIKWFLEKERK